MELQDFYTKMALWMIHYEIMILLLFFGWLFYNAYLGVLGIFMALLNYIIYNSLSSKDESLSSTD